MRPPHLALKLYAAWLDARMRRAVARPRETQARLLAALIAEYQGTEVGQRLGLAGIDSPEAFRARVPVTDETLYQPLCQQALESNPPDLVTRGPLRHMARSSGTTKASKLVAFSKPLIKAYKRYETAVAMHTMRELGSYDLLDAQLLITAGSPSVETTPSGVVIGYGTGIMTTQAPAVARSIVRPTREILEMTDWEAKLEATVQQAMPLDIRAMTGVPLFAVQVLERLLAYAREQGREVAHARELWPNLRVYYWSGSPIDLYEARLRALLGPDVPFRELYTCTESPLGYQYRFGEPGNLLNLTDTYFEFQPADGPIDGPRLGVEAVEPGVPYRVLISTWGGLFAYRLGDRVEFVSTDPPLVRIVGRERDEISLGYEHIGQAMIEGALNAVAAAEGNRVLNYLVGPARSAEGEKQAYHWYLELEHPPADPAAWGRGLDQQLGALHPMYASMREGDTVLLPPRLTVLPTGTIDRYVLETRQFGQGKFLHLYNQRDVPEAIERHAGLTAEACD